MAYKYEYKGKATITIYVDGKGYTLGGENNPRIGNTVELPRKVEMQDLVLIEEDEEKKVEKKYSKKKTK